MTSLLKSHQVAEHFQEMFILSGYRPKSDARRCLTSMFELNNETINFWTHFLPALFFLWKVVTMWDRFDFSHDSFTWPLLAYMLCLCTFPLCSAIAHIFNSMSDKARHVSFFWDYASICQYSLGAAIAYKAYIFPKGLVGSWFDAVYLKIAVFNAVVCLILSCKTRFMENGFRKKIFRFSGFAVPYLYDSLPVFYRVLFCEGDECEEGGLYLHKRQFLYGFLAALIYVTHIPERFSPGTFDIVGQSHQIFHMITVLGSEDQREGLMQDMEERRDYLLAHHDVPRFSTSIGLMTILAVVNICVVIYYSNKMTRHLRQQKHATSPKNNNTNSSHTNGNYKMNGAGDYNQYQLRSRTKDINHVNGNSQRDSNHINGDHGGAKPQNGGGFVSTGIVQGTKLKKSL